MPLGYGALIKQHFQDLVPEEVFEGVGVVIQGDTKAALFVKVSIRYDYVAVGIEGEEVAKGLDRAGAARLRFVRPKLSRRGVGHVLLQCIVSIATQVGKQLAVEHKAMAD